MTPSEPARLALYNRLGEVIGPENAETLMSSLPVQPAAIELATKDDIARIEQRIDSITNELRDIREQMGTQYRTFLIATVGAMTALTGIFSVIVGLVT